MDRISELGVTKLPTLSLLVCLILSFVLAKWLAKHTYPIFDKRKVAWMALGLIVLAVVLKVPIFIAIGFGLISVLFYGFNL